MTVRDWRAGELRLLAAALVVAVAAVTSVGFLVDRVRLGLERDATQLLGADLVLSSDTPIDASLDEQARAAPAADCPDGDISQHGDQRARRRSHVVVSRQGGVAGVSTTRQPARGRC